MTPLILLPLAAAILVASCNQSPTPSTPTLPPPTAQAPAAETKVEASSGPVKLTLELRKTRISAAKDGGLIYFRASIHNVGGDKFPVNDPLFKNPYEMNQPVLGGTYLDVQDSAGRQATRLFIPSGHDPVTVLADDGLSPAQREWFRQKALNPGWTSAPGGEPKAHYLSPGESVTTPEWWGPYAMPIKGFTRAPFEPLKSGRYTIKLVYDWKPSPQLMKTYAEFRKSPPPSFIRLETPTVPIEVLP